MSRRFRGWILGAGAAFALALVVGWLVLQRRSAESAPELCSALRQQRLDVLYVMPGASLSCPSVRTLPADEALRSALSTSDGSILRKALTRHKAAGLALAPRLSGQAAATLTDQLSHFAVPAELRAAALSPQLAVYAPRRDAELTLRERDALAYVARGLLRGAREPSLNSFPPSLRRVERVEVMVMLREHGEPRLWRSARSTSLARALLTATRVARDRWREREAAMGGPLARRLLDLDVEVSLLSEEGTLLASDQSFIDSAVSAEYGIGFEYGASWHYVLPEDIERRGRGSPYRALVSLLSEQGLSVTSMRESAFRAYRFVTVILGVSKAPLAGEASPG